MSDWTLAFDGHEPAREGLREVLCATGNGYLVTRAAMPDATADGVHYPGTYLAGGYDRLASEVAGHRIEMEDLVNLPNWLPLRLRIGDGDWLGPGTVEHLDDRQAIDLRGGVQTRARRFRDREGRVTRWEERRLVSMDDPHLCALEVTVTPENWSGRLGLRSALDGSVTNAGVPRYGALASRHLETLAAECTAEGVLGLRSRMVQSRREIGLAARTRVEAAGGVAAPLRTDCAGDTAAVEFEVEAEEGRGVRVEKVAAYVTSADRAVGEPLADAVGRARDAPGFGALLEAHRRAWAHLWEQCDIRIDSASDRGAQVKLRLHVFHLLQTASRHSVEMDVGIPPRGWHGEAYRGKVMWDELFIFPYLNLRMPVLTRALLRYRFHRLDAARAAARAAGHRGAMFPWQSGATGREESQRLHLNPVSGRWVPDNTWRQHHVGAAIAWNVWSYYEATGDSDFLSDYGAELFCEIARFWASLAEERPDGRFGIRGVMGPDEFHTAYPGADPSAEGGLDNNAYTNFMVSWLLAHVPDVLDLMPRMERLRLCEDLRLTEEELERWDEISRRLFIPFHGDGIVSQFEGYGELAEFDWEGFRARHGNVQRLDRILEAEGKDPNDWKVSKQADALMIFYLFTREEIEQGFDRLGYEFHADRIFRNVEYYMARTSHGSTLSWVTHAWVLARCDRQRSWELALDALDVDVGDVQGGTTREGIHLGAMAGTVDLIQRCYTGVELRAGVLQFNPRLPEEVRSLGLRLRYRRQILDVEVTQERLTVSSRLVTAHPVTIAYRGHSREIAPGQTFSFRLVPERKTDRPARERAQERAREEGPRHETAEAER